MDVLVPLVVLALLAAVVWVVAAPLREGPRPESAVGAAREELEAAKAAKYSEIRDADLDHRTGKLDDADWRVVDRQLRAEAVALLRRLDALGDEPEDTRTG